MTPSRLLIVVTAVAAAFGCGASPARAESLRDVIIGIPDIQSPPETPIPLPPSGNPAISRILESQRMIAAFRGDACGPGLTPQQFVQAAATTGGCGTPRAALLIDAIRGSPSVRADYRANACGSGLSPAQFVYSYVTTGGCGATPEERQRIQSAASRQQAIESMQANCRRRDHLVLGEGGRPDTLFTTDSCYGNPPPEVLPSHLSSTWGSPRPSRQP